MVKTADLEAVKAKATDPNTILSTIAAPSAEEIRKGKEPESKIASGPKVDAPAVRGSANCL